jgi:hypothetical protein
MRGIKTMTGLHYEVATDQPARRHLAVAFTDLARAI